MTERSRHLDRRDRLRALLAERLAAPVGWLLVTDLPNVRYLTGFSGSNAVLAICTDDPGQDLLGTDGRYAEQVLAESPGLATVIERGTLAAVVAAVSRPGPPGAIAVEASMPWSDVLEVQSHGWDVRVAPALIERLRVVKDEAEAQCLATACRITADAFDVAFQEIRPGMTELALARRIEQLFGELGAHDRAFATIVASGPNAARPHHQPGQRQIGVGDLLVIDAGAQVDGYHADMTRTVIVGSEPAAWQAEIHACVQRSQHMARQAAVAGQSMSAIDAAAREVISAAGYAEAFVHGLGHGVGLEIHEAPMITARATGSICASTSITIEPGIYLPGRGGVRIEDTVMVESGGSRVLTELPRDLTMVG